MEKVFDLNLMDVLEKLKEDPKKMFQGDRFKKGVALIADNNGILQVETFEEDKVSTTLSTFVVSTKTHSARYREVLNKNQLF